MLNILLQPIESWSKGIFHLFRPKSKELFQLNLGTLVQTAVTPNETKPLPCDFLNAPAASRICSAFSALSDRFGTAEEQNACSLLSVALAVLRLYLWLSKSLEPNDC